MLGSILLVYIYDKCALRRVPVGFVLYHRTWRHFERCPSCAVLVHGACRLLFAKSKDLAHAYLHISDRCVARVHAMHDRDGDGRRHPVSLNSRKTHGGREYTYLAGVVAVRQGAYLRMQ